MPPAGPPLSTDAEEGESVGAAILPANLRILKVFLRRLAEPKADLGDRAAAACVCLAEALKSLRTAAGAFEQATKISPSLAVAYRDCGLTYYSIAQCEAALGAIAAAKLPSGGALSAAAPVALPPNLDRAMFEGQNALERALDHLVAAKEEAALVAAENRDLLGAEDAMAKHYITAALKPGDSAAEHAAGAGGARAPKPADEYADLPRLRMKLRGLRESAAKLTKELAKEERRIARKVAAASAEVAASCDVLGRSATLQRAQRAARAACETDSYTDSDSLKLLALIYAAEGNFDRAEYYQKLAVIFAREDDRPEILATLNVYREMGDFILEKKLPKTPPAAAGQAKGAKPSDQEGAD